MIILKVTWIVAKSLEDNSRSYVIKYIMGICIKGMKSSQSGNVIFIKGCITVLRSIFKRVVKDRTNYLIIHFIIVFLGDTFRY